MSTYTLMDFTDEEAEYNPVIGPVTTGLINRLNWPSSATDQLLKSSVGILQSGIVGAKGTGSSTGLVIGYVQSGKTMSFTTVMALAADNQFRLAIVLAGIANNLLEQTQKRLSEELDVAGENTWRISVADQTDNISRLIRASDKPLIILPVLKHHKRINELTENLKGYGLSSDELGTVLIFDDEADQASFNTFASVNSKKKDQTRISSTYNAITRLRKFLTNHIYLQYTATPQAPLLISMNDVLSPDWQHILEPGNGYFGGKELFQNRSKQTVLIPSTETYHSSDNPLNTCPKSLKQAVLEFVIACVIHLRLRDNHSVISMMVHPDRKIHDHKKFVRWIEGFLDEWTVALDEGSYAYDGFKKELQDAFKRYRSQIDECPTFETIVSHLGPVLSRIRCKHLHGSGDELNWKSEKAVIIVGADLLNRGFTVEGLTITYMPRYSKSKSMADTLQQRARFFGYKSDRSDLIRVYLPASTIAEYESYVEDEEALRQILKGCQDLSELGQTIVQSDLMKPTRSNILSKKAITANLKGAKQFETHGLDKVIRNNQRLIEFTRQLSDDGRLFPYTNFGTDDRNHAAGQLKIDEAINLLANLKFGTLQDASLKTAILQYLVFWRDKGINEIGFLFMAYKNEYRERSVKSDGENLKINSLFTGQSTKGKEVYPGDSVLTLDGQITLQLYRIKPKESIDGIDVIYAPAFILPEDLATSFASTYGS